MKFTNLFSGKKIIFLLLLITIAIIGLFIYGQTNSPAIPQYTEINFGIGDNAKLVCTDECRAQAQCGSLMDSTDVVVFTAQRSPATQNHKWLIPHNSSARVVEPREMQLVGISGLNSKAQHTFYRVDHNNVSMWVAGWCMARDGT